MSKLHYKPRTKLSGQRKGAHMVPRFNRKDWAILQELKEAVRNIDLTKKNES